MTKAELIERIARSRDLPPDTSKKLIGQVLGIAFDELASYFARARVTRSQSPRFTFPRFGTFTKKRRSARRGVNPRTLEPIQIDACNTIDFKASRELRDAMNPTSRAGDGAELGDGIERADAIEVAEPTAVAPAPAPMGATSKGASKKKAKARAKLKAVRPRDGVKPLRASPTSVVAIGPSKRRLTLRDEADLDELATGSRAVDPGAELPASPMQRVPGRRRTRSRGTG